jgi:Mg-chelatase subunit ChlD
VGLQIEPEEHPKTETVSYILEAAPVKKTESVPTKEGETTSLEEAKNQKQASLAKDISIVYCIDISGSMAGHRLECVKKTIQA